MQEKRAVVVQLDANVSHQLGVAARAASLTKAQMAAKVLAESLASHPLVLAMLAVSAP